VVTPCATVKASKMQNDADAQHAQYKDTAAEKRIARAEANAAAETLGAVMRRRRGWRDRWRPRLQERPASPTLFIECTLTYRSDATTGIQRVVRNVLRNAAMSAARYGYVVAPMILDNNRFVPADLNQVLADKLRARLAKTETPPRVPGFARSCWRLLLRALSVMFPFAPAQRFLYASPDQLGLAWCILLPLRALRLRPWPQHMAENGGAVGLDEYANCDGSILVLLDASWGLPIWPAVKRFRQSGGKVVSVIYDLIPISHPHTCLPTHIVAFKAWLRESMRYSDFLIGISRSTADQVAQFAGALAENGKNQLDTPVIDHFHLGSELDLVEREDQPRPDIKRIFDAKRHVFVMVGSIEPRKNHGYVLDAFDAHWARGGDAALVMIGRHGWKNETFLERVAGHEQLGERLFLVRDATDTEVDHAYRHASALIIASEVEGFGLPVVEAFQRGLPVLCSDIPIFREIADGKAIFFDLSHNGRLADAITEFCSAHSVEQRDIRTPQSWITWRQSTDQLCAAIMRALGQEPVSAASHVPP
jgi:O-antigen biosynthesis alpha-1,2-rhamnosyltransferase